MTTAVLEIHDAGLLALGPDGRPRALPSPGFALFEAAELLVGSAAMARARLHPRFVHSRFWDRLETGPLKRPFPATSSPADLAHAHLLEVWTGAGLAGVVERVLLTVPSWYSAEELSLLLGIARACEIPVAGVVDGAVAAASAALTHLPGGAGSTASLIHLDLHLHRATATRLATDDEGLAAVAGETSDATGLVPLYDRLAKEVSRRFVLQTRFDPMHAAESEQLLFDVLPLWLEELEQHEEILVTLPARDREYRVELDRGLVRTALEPTFDVLAELSRSVAPEAAGATVLLPPRLALLPGLREHLGTSALVLPPAAAASGALALALAESLPQDGDGIVHLTRLTAPARDRSAAARDPQRSATPPRSPVRAGGVPTHLLYDAHAFRIASEPLLVRLASPARGELEVVRLDDDHDRPASAHFLVLRHDGEVRLDERGGLVRRNGEPAEGRTTLSTGDRLRFARSGHELLLIELHD